METETLPPPTSTPAESAAPAAPAARQPYTPPPQGKHAFDGSKPASVSDVFKSTVKTGAGDPNARVTAPAPAEPAAKPAESAKPAHQAKAAEAVAPVVEASDPLDELRGPPDNAPEKIKADWKELKKMAKQARAEAEELKKAKAQPAQQSTATPAGDPAEVENLRKAVQEREARLKAAEDRLLLVDVQAHPKFIAQYAEPKAKALTEAAEVLSWSDRKADLGTLLAKTPKEFNAEVAKLTEGLNSMDATTVQTSLRQAYKIQADEQTALADARKTHESFQQDAKRRARSAFDSVSNEIMANLKPIEVTENSTPEEKALIEAHNAELPSVKALAERYTFNPSDERAMAMIGHKAAAADIMSKHTIPILTSRIAAASKLIAEQADVIKSLQAARSPGSFSANGTPPQATQRGPGGVPKPMSAADVWGKTVGKSGLPAT